MNQRTEATHYIAVKLSLIFKENGYNTDIGRRIYVGEHAIQDMESPCIILVPKEEVPRFPGDSFGAAVISYDIFALENWSGPATPFAENVAEGQYIVIDDMIDDIKKVIDSCNGDENLFIETINYLSGDPVYSTGGANNIAAQINIEVSTVES